MIRIAAVDDEFHVLERFDRMLKKYADIELCGLFERPEQLLTYLKKEPLDVVFLDIEMPEISGLELSSRILDMNKDITIIFVTAYNQYAVEAFEVEAMDYILKPLTEERLGKTINRLKRNIKAVNTVDKPFIQCIGSFEVFLGKTALPWKSSKAKEIFAFLIQNDGVPSNWEKIADAVWPNYNSEKAQTNFHATTYLLRKWLAEVGLSHIIENGRGNYRIVKDNVECDLYQIETLINRGMIKRKEDLRMFERLNKKGYMEASGYNWAQPKAAELLEQSYRVLDEHMKDQ